MYVMKYLLIQITCVHLLLHFLLKHIGTITILPKRGNNYKFQQWAVALLVVGSLLPEIWAYS